ncbi:MAG: SDR family oxidoreductase [Bacteroidaceae bacterium]|nr:SDR family oxidoreductase [Bacteroidaceae bacterium]
MFFMLKEKNAIITGARRGIGRATVEVFAKNGANVWACARAKDEAFEADMSQLAEKYGVEIMPVYFDVTNEAEVKQAIQTIRKTKMSIDVLVNVAGIVGDVASFQMSSMDSIREVMETNFFAVTLLTQYVTRLMTRQNKGSIIYVSSIAGLDGTPSQYAYAASKAALVGAMKNLAREVAANHIRVNAVAPGMIETEMGAQIEASLKTKMLEKVIMNRMGRPEEIANVIAFLGSDLSSYMTGQVVRVDGGV